MLRVPTGWASGSVTTRGAAPGAHGGPLSGTSTIGTTVIAVSPSVTLISASVLVVLALSGSYVEPYSSPIGQVILLVLLSSYVGTLVWMRRMATGKPLPRFLKTRPEAMVAR